MTIPSLAMDNSMDLISKLPRNNLDHVIELILLHLDFDSRAIAAASRVSKSWLEIFSNKITWIGLTKRYARIDDTFASVCDAQETGTL